MESIFTVFVSALTVAVSADAQSVLLAGFDGRSPRHQRPKPDWLTDGIAESFAFEKSVGGVAASICESFNNGKKLKGFFHALGHGVGLEIHEAPVLRSKAPSKLRKSMAVTVEPGLYHEGLGGCRIEDRVHLVPGGCELFSRAPYKWEIA